MQNITGTRQIIYLKTNSLYGIILERIERQEIKTKEVGNWGSNIVLFGFIATSGVLEWYELSDKYSY